MAILAPPLGFRVGKKGLGLEGLIIFCNSVQVKLLYLHFNRRNAYEVYKKARYDGNPPQLHSPEMPVLEKVSSPPSHRGNSQNNEDNTGCEVGSPPPLDNMTNEHFTEVVLPSPDNVKTVFQVETWDLWRVVEELVNVNNGTFECGLCNYHDPLRNNIIMHISQGHFEWNPWKCRHCSYAARTRSLVLDHLKVAHAGVVPCIIRRCYNITGMWHTCP